MAAGAVAAVAMGGIGGGVFVAVGGGGGGAAWTGSPATGFCSPDFFRGLSHFSQRIPLEIAAPHMKHFEAIGRFRTENLTRDTVWQ